MLNLAAAGEEIDGWPNIVYICNGSTCFPATMAILRWKAQSDLKANALDGPCCIGLQVWVAVIEAADKCLNPVALNN